jgi:hypothetical protein
MRSIILFALWIAMADTSVAAPPSPWSNEFPTWQQSVESRLDSLQKKTATKSPLCPCDDCKCDPAKCPAGCPVSAVAAPTRFVKVCNGGTCSMVPVTGAIDPKDWGSDLPYPPWWMTSATGNQSTSTVNDSVQATARAHPIRGFLGRLIHPFRKRTAAGGGCCGN